MAAFETCRQLNARASLTPLGTLPDGDPRIWAHTVTDLVAAFLREEGCRRVVETTGDCLRRDFIEDAVQRLIDAGVQSGEVVICEVQNSIRSVANMLACWLMGCCVCPLDPSTPTAVKALIERESGARGRVLPSGDVERVVDRDSCANVGLIRLRRPWRVTGPDLALCIFTSGSSGVPKGVLLSHSNVMSALRSISGYLNLRPTDRILGIPPIFFDYGLYQLLLSMFDGCTLILNPGRHDALTLMKIIERQLPTILPVVPAIASAISRLFGSVDKKCTSVRLITNTGGHLSQAAIDMLYGVFSMAHIIPMYGLTECKRALYYDIQGNPGRRDSVGGPIPGLAAAVIVEDIRTNSLRLALTGEVGELYVRGPSVMQGYHREQSSAAARLLCGAYRDDNWLATGDLFCTDEDGLFYFRGRATALIKQGGYCIYPREVERMVEEHPEIAAASIVGRQEASGDESAVLFVQLMAGSHKSARKRVAMKLRCTLPRSLMPREIRFVDDWPTTPNGKIDVRALTLIAFSEEMSR